MSENVSEHLLVCKRCLGSSLGLLQCRLKSLKPLYGSSLHSQSYTSACKIRRIENLCSIILFIFILLKFGYIIISNSLYTTYLISSSTLLCINVSLFEFNTTLLIDISCFKKGKKKCNSMVLNSVLFLPHT